MSQQYSAVSPDDLIWHKLDVMSLIYHKPSGLTHIVADPVPAILEAMQLGASTVSEICKFLQDNYELENIGEIENVVSARLDEIHRLGLIDRVSV